MHRFHKHGHHGRHDDHDGQGSRAEFWGAGRHRGGRFGGFGFGGRFGGSDGMGDDDMMMARRILGQGDLRLLALALIAEAPRHGYEIIKLVEEKTGSFYSPSPGIVYPTLTYLEEAGYVTASTDGAKKLYTLTDEGKAYLDANRDIVKAVLDRLAAIGEKVSRRRRAQGGEREQELPPLVDAAIRHLRDVVAKRLKTDADAEARLVEVLARTAADLQQRN
jgi:DNA-binding PadR family transcriptional regulator